MPKRSIYIKEEDLELWDNLKNKSQSISEFLNGKEISQLKTTEQQQIRLMRQIAQEEIRNAMEGRY